MIWRRLIPLLPLLAIGFPAGAEEAASTRLAPQVRFVQRALETAAAKPGGPVVVPEPFRGAVANLPAGGGAIASNAEPTLALLVLTSDEGASLRAAGFAVSTQAGAVSVVRAPLSRLAELDALPAVVRADLSLPMNPKLDVSRYNVNADDANGAAQPPYPPSGATGRGVVVGIVDSGIDVTHDDFRKADGTTRISYLWDQTDPSQVPGPPDEFPCSDARSWCGSQWLASQINGGEVRQQDVIGHGSHVAGIAAGDGSATGNGQPAFQFVGMAPEAELIVVNTSFLSDAIIEGVDFIQRRAGSKPSVVNLSLGSQFGPHDGTDVFDLAMNGLSGPGKIIVAAAGNEGDLAIHAEWLIQPGQTKSFPLFVGTRSPQAGAQNDIVWMEAWYDGARSLTFALKSPNGAQTVGPVAPGAESSRDTGDGAMIVENALSANPNGDRLATIIAYDNSATRPPREGTWTIEVRNTGAQAAEVDIWIALSTLVTAGGIGADVRWAGDVVDFSELITSPASADSVIGVGAYCTKRVWPSADGSSYQYSSPEIQVGLLAPFSSPGPRRDGALKPDLSAPGIGIGSAISVHANPEGDITSLLPDRKHTINQGTSQSAPHVAGAVALILERRPRYAFREVAAALRATARADVNTGAVPNPLWGRGKLDVNAAAAFVVPVRLLAMSAAWEEGSAVLRWTLAETEPGTAFVVERGAAETGDFAAKSGYLTGDVVFAWNDPDPSEAEPWYRVRVLSRSGDVTFFGPVRLERAAFPVALLQNAPNPFAAATSIAFTLDRTARVRLEVLDPAGRLVRVLEDGERAAGRHETAWDGAAADGRRVAAGVYFYRLAAPGRILVRRMILTG